MLGRSWLEVAVERELSVASGMEVMQKMLGLMKRVCAAGYRAWLERSEATEAVIEREGQTPRFDDGEKEDREKIVDFYHAIEHVALASEALFGKGTHAAKAWTARHRHSRLDHDDGPKRIIRAIDHALQTRRVSRSARLEALKQRQYFRNTAARMTYASFRARGLPNGSGPVEPLAKP